MDREYTEYLSQPYIRCVQHPGTCAESFEQEYITMRPPEFIHPTDLLAQTTDRIALIGSFILFTDIDHGPVVMTDQTRDGLYYSIAEIADTLKHIHHQLENEYQVKPLCTGK
jgi:hypothetical protein